MRFLEAGDSIAGIGNSLVFESLKFARAGRQVSDRAQSPVESLASLEAIATRTESSQRTDHYAGSPRINGALSQLELLSTELKY